MRLGASTYAGVAQWLERHVANVNVVGSNPITRSLLTLLSFAEGVAFSFASSGFKR